MGTQSNKQSQNLKIVINNNVSPQRKRRPRRKPQAQPPENTGEMPSPVPPMPQFATGLSPYQNRPAIFSPSMQVIHADNGLHVPPYFEKPYTNREASLTEMRRALAAELEDVKEALFAQVANPQQAHRVMNSIANSAMSAMDAAAPSLPSVFGGGSSMSEDLSIPQAGSGVSGFQPQFSASIPDTSVGSIGGNSSGVGNVYGSESTVQGGRPPSNTSQGLLPVDSLPNDPDEAPDYSQVGAIPPLPLHYPPMGEGQGSVGQIPMPMLSDSTLGSPMGSVNQPPPLAPNPQGGYGGVGSTSGGGYGGMGSVSMGSGGNMGSRVEGGGAAPVYGASSGYGGDGSVVGQLAPLAPNPQGGYGGVGSTSGGGYGGMGSVSMGSVGNMGSRVEGGMAEPVNGGASGSSGAGSGVRTPPNPVNHPHTIATALYTHYRQASGNARKLLAQQIRSIGEQYGIRARHLSDILRELLSVNRQ